MDYIKEIKEIVAEQAYEQLKHNLDKVDTKELGEVVDMIKDTAEAAYYCSVVEAMEKAEKEAQENGNGNVVYYTERYLPYPERERMMDRKYNRYYDDRMYYDWDERKYADGNSNGSSSNMSNSSRGGSHYYTPYYDYNEPVMRDMAAGRV